MREGPAATGSYRAFRAAADQEGIGRLCQTASRRRTFLTPVQKPEACREPRAMADVFSLRHSARRNSDEDETSSHRARHCRLRGLDLAADAKMRKHHKASSMTTGMGGGANKSNAANPSGQGNVGPGTSNNAGPNSGGK